jgi:hypothetical protein
MDTHSNPQQSPSPTAADGGDRGPNGRFVKGNRCSVGNPFGRRVNELRKALLEALDPDAIKRIVRKLIERAEHGDLAAVQVLFDRCLGKVGPAPSGEPDDEPEDLATP